MTIQDKVFRPTDGRPPRALRPEKRSEIRLPSRAYDWIKTTVAPSGDDAVFAGSNGQRAIGVFDAVESQLGLKMLTANQVLFWRALQAAGVQPSVEGYGTLFSKNAAPV